MYQIAPYLVLRQQAHCQIADYWSNELGMKEAVLYAGTVGLGFGFSEKLLQGGVALIQNAVLPSHALFQWIMGYYIYKAQRTEGTERRSIFSFLSLFIPYVVHDLWDFGLEGGGVLLGGSFALSIKTIEAVIMLACIVINVVVFIVAVIKIKKIKEPLE